MADVRLEAGWHDVWINTETGEAVTGAPPVVGFVAARLAEDESGARSELRRARAEGWEGWLGRVLRDVAAKRVILERAARPVNRITADEDGPFPFVVFADGSRLYADPEHTLDVTDRWKEWADAHREPADPDTLRDLAAAWSDHPDWRAEWW